MLRRGSGQPDDQSGVTDQGVRRSRAASWILPAETGVPLSHARTSRRGQRVCGTPWKHEAPFARRVGNRGVKNERNGGRRKTPRRNHARAGWLGAVPCDSGKAPGPRGPRKAAALVGYGRNCAPWA